LITFDGFTYSSYIGDVLAGTGTFCDDPHTGGSLVNIIDASELPATLMHQHRAIAVCSIAAKTDFSLPFNLLASRISRTELYACFIGSTTQAIMGHSSA
jgi:hypothetical protein